jgi:hypothetical protein
VDLSLLPSKSVLSARWYAVKRDATRIRQWSSFARLKHCAVYSIAIG